MSTKIYNGYWITDNSLSDIKTLRKFCIKHHVKFTKLRETLAAQIVANQATHKFDKACIEGKEADFSKIATDVTFKIWERVRQKNSTRMRDPEIDLECSVCIIPIQNKILALFFSEQEKFTKYWRSIPEVQEYHYQNSTDKPDSISKKDWDQRRKDWDEALPGVGIPAQNGFSYTFGDDYFPNVPGKSVIKHLPRFETRLDREAKQVFLDEKWSEYTKANNLDEKEVRPSQFIEWHINHKDWRDTTDEGKKAFAKRKDEIEKLLIKKITL